MRKKADLTSIYNKKEYYYRLIESEILIKDDIEVSLQKLSILNKKKVADFNQIENEN